MSSCIGHCSGLVKDGKPATLIYKLRKIRPFCVYIFTMYFFLLCVIRDLFCLHSKRLHNIWVFVNVKNPYSAQQKKKKEKQLEKRSY